MFPGLETTAATLDAADQSRDHSLTIAGVVPKPNENLCSMESLSGSDRPLSLYRAKPMPRL